MKKSNINIFLLLAGAAAGALGSRKIISQRAERNQEMSDKYMSLFLMMNQWVKIKQEGKSLISYFAQKKYYRIAVYGMSYVGNTLVNELAGTNIEIKYGIDQNAEIICDKLNIISPDDEMENVDAIVVTPVTSFVEIEERLRRKVDCPILSLEDILFEL